MLKLVVAQRALIEDIDDGLPLRLEGFGFERYDLELLTAPEQLEPGMLIGVFNGQAGDDKQFRVYTVAKEPLIKVGQGNGGPWVLLRSGGPDSLAKPLPAATLGLKISSTGRRDRFHRTFRLTQRTIDPPAEA
jgi:hypothetical protein